MMFEMEWKDQTVRIEMTHEEAYELLVRCIQSPDQDTPVSHSAIQVLARAIKELDEAVEAAG
ncbi:MAG: hypothetical protein IIC73_06465 [Armatimonadetes bacterium]|nr:hypothetical protein [Armatimonadota bacterium]